MTRLPLALEPLPDESWPSYLTRRAAQHGTTLAGLGSHLGLRDERGRWPGRFGVSLSPGHVERVAPILGLAPHQVENMQLATYDQLAFDLSGLQEARPIAGTRAAVHSSWVWLAGSTFCPSCLTEDDGAWRTSWRIPWITTCLRHEVGLRGHCRECGVVPGLGNRFHGSAPMRVAAAPDGRRCQVPMPDGQSCGADLSRQETPAADAARTQRAQRIDSLVAGSRGRVAGIDRTSLQTLRAWQSSIGIAVRLGVVDADGWGRTHRWANPPRDPDVIERLLETVEPLITARTPAASADVLDAWLRAAGVGVPHADTFDRITQPAAALRPVIDDLLGRHGRAHTLIKRRLTSEDGNPIDARGWDVDDIPQLVWPCALPEHLRHSARPDQRILRAVVSMILIRMCTDVTNWVDAGAALGFPPDKAHNWSRYAFASRWALKRTLLEAAQCLRYELGHQPTRHEWHRRPRLEGNGLAAYRNAQQPGCSRDGIGNVWCACAQAADV